jgi:hypothetical protein
MNNSIISIPLPKPMAKTLVYKDTEEELKRIEIDKNIYLRLLKIGGEEMVDIRRFYREFPTKKGIRMSLETFNNIKNLF